MNDDQAPKRATTSQGARIKINQKSLSRKSSIKKPGGDNQLVKEVEPNNDKSQQEADGPQQDIKIQFMDVYSEASYTFRSQ